MDERGRTRRDLGDRSENADAPGVRVGLRNPVGMAWEPETGALWVAVNERDELGSDLVPDYMTSVRDGAILRMAVQLLRPTCRRPREATAAGAGRGRR